MKKILCFILAFLLSFNAITCNVFAEGFSGSSTDYNIPSKDILKELPADAPKSTETFLKHVYFQPMTEFFNSLGIDIWGDNKVWSEDTSKFILDNATKDNNVTTDGNYYYINANFIKNINEKVQENIHALDGYWIFEPAHSLDELPMADIIQFYRDNSKYDSDKNKKEYYNSDQFVSDINALCANEIGFCAYPLYFNDSSVYAKRLAYIERDKCGFGDTYYFVHNPSFTDLKVTLYKNQNGKAVYLDGNCEWKLAEYSSQVKGLGVSEGCYVEHIKYNLSNSYGSPVRIFYSPTDLQHFLDNHGRQYYAPQLPIANIRIPVTYINNINTNKLPDFNFNTGSLVGKAEADIQGEIDLTLKNYLDHLIELNNNKPAPTSTPTPTKPPTPTKAPTSTPAPVTPITVTPTPVLPNVTVSPTPSPEDFSSINKWLEQIYNWLLDFGDKHQTFTEKICKYIDSTDGKLDQIIEAIDRLSQGDTTGEANGCKYDYTALSEFMTQLWNESDKKFDKMVELLEENNKYQQKIVDSLNQIKALLVADTVLDVFRNRSNETANKAKEKFPTSLPWDIALVVNAFSAPPKEPVIELPIKIESMHIDEKIVVDLSSEEWTKLAKTCRYLLSILFVLYMVHLSRKFFSKGDD